MNKLVETRGACLCGSVKLTTKSASPTVGACHCSICRQWTGGPYMAVDCGTDVSFSSEENIGLFASSEWAERGFCKKCGSSLFYKLKASGQYIISAGILELESELDFDHQVFIDEKPDYYCFSNRTKDLTGTEVFAMFGSD